MICKPNSYREIRETCPNCAFVFKIVWTEADPSFYCHRNNGDNTLYWGDEVDVNGTCDEWCGVV